MKLSLHHILVLFLALSVTVGCDSAVGATSPEAAVGRAGFGSLEDVQIVGVRTFGDQALVLYTGVARLDGAGAPRSMLGYTYVSLTSTGWRAENRGAMGASALHNPAEMLQYSVGKTQTPTEIRTQVIGLVLDPQIASVEAAFDNGRTARDAVTNDVFAVIMIGANAVCALRAFDGEGREMQLPDHIAVPPGPGC
jgi:hypothetical protein